MDFDADQWAKLRKQPHLAIPSRWDQYGNAAGSIRDGWMLVMAKTMSVALRKDLHVLSFPGEQACAEKAADSGLHEKKID